MIEMIPRGVILDLLDLYDLEIEVIYTFLEDYRYKPPLKLNLCFKELKGEMLSLITIWGIGKWNPDRLIDDRTGLSTFYIPFYSDLFSEVVYRNQPESIWDEWGQDATAIMATMHKTRKLIKDLIKARRVNADDVERDGDVQEIVTRTKSVLEELRTERKYGVSTPQPRPRTKAEMVEEREEESRRMKEALGEAYELLGYDKRESAYELNRRMRLDGFETVLDTTISTQIDAKVGDKEYHYDDSWKKGPGIATAGIHPTTITISFSEGLPGIVVGGKDCSLTRLSDQLKVARVMLSGKSGVGDKHHWETIHKKISKTPLADRGHRGPQKEKIKEAVRGINKNIKKIPGIKDDLFKWGGGGYLVRNF